MGGRGSSGNIGNGPNGRKISIKRFLENLQRNNRQGMLDVAAKSKLTVNDPVFTANYNAIKSQEAVLESGSDKVSIRFFNNFDPLAVGKPNNPIKTSIEVVTYKNGNATAVRVLEETKSTSLKNAKKNYEEMLEKWKKITKQKTIKFR